MPGTFQGCSRNSIQKKIILEDKKGYIPNIASFLGAVLSNPGLKRHITQLQLHLPEPRVREKPQPEFEGIKKEALCIVRASDLDNRFKRDLGWAIKNNLIREWYIVLLLVLPRIKRLVLYEPERAMRTIIEPWDIDLPQFLLTFEYIFGNPKYLIERKSYRLSCLAATSATKDFAKLASEDQDESDLIRKVEIHVPKWQRSSGFYLHVLNYHSIRRLRLDCRLYRIENFIPRGPYVTSTPARMFFNNITDVLFGLRLEELEFYAESAEEMRQLIATPGYCSFEGHPRWASYSMQFKATIGWFKEIRSLEMPGGPWCEWLSSARLQFLDFTRLERLVVQRKMLQDGINNPLVVGQAVDTFPPWLRYLKILDADEKTEEWVRELARVSNCEIELAGKYGDVLQDEWATLGTFN